MTRHCYDLITSLPTLGALGSDAPTDFHRLREMVVSDGASLRAVEAVALGDDLLLREALLAEEISEATPSVLTPGQLGNDHPLPEYLQPQATGRTRRIAADAVWEGYYGYVLRIADEIGVEFLSRWGRYEIGLRNALVLARAKALNLPPADYLVLPDQGPDERSYAKVVAEWSAAADPLAGARVIDSARWQWLQQNDAWFSFSRDELAAYSAKLILLLRWQRLERARIETPTPEPDAAPAT